MENYFEFLPFILTALLFIGLYFAVSAYSKAPKVKNGEFTQQQVNITGIIGICAAGVSVFFAAAFAWTMADNLMLQVGFVVVFLAIQGAEFTGASHLVRAWREGRLFLSALMAFSIVIGVLVSIVAGQSLIATRVDILEQERLRNSEIFRIEIESRENANKNAASLAVDATVADSARQKLSELNAEIEAIYTANTAFMSRDCTPKTDNNGRPFKTRADAACSQVKALKRQVFENELIVRQYNEYQAALAHAKSINSQPLPTSAVTGVLPHIQSLSDFTGLDANIIKSNFNIIIAALAEFTALLFLFAWGEMRSVSGKIPPATVSYPHIDGIPALEVGGRIKSDGLAVLHEGEAVLTKKAVEKLDRLNIIDFLNRNAEKKGSHYCANCGAEISTLKRADARYCSEKCRTSRKKQS
jgi:hypothetical protein